MSFRLLLILIVPLIACGGAAEGDQQVEAVLKFLIASNGMGHFERGSAYCIAGPNGTDVSADLLTELDMIAGRVLDEQECIGSDSPEGVIVREDGVPAVVIWAFQPSREELERFSAASYYGLELDDYSMIMAGFFKSGSHAADYVCWVTQESRPEVALCDVIGIA